MHNGIIARCIDKHGDRYNYSKVVYINSKTKIEIVCKIHGSFMQNPAHHYARGHGCPICAKELRELTAKDKVQKGNKNDPLLVPAFIDRASKIHNYVYDYSKVQFSSVADKVTIGCKVHGDFTQSVSNHIHGKATNGCPTCGTLRASESKQSTKEEFVVKANSVHHNKYTYDNVVYTKAKEKVIITCPEHGDFQQLVSGHLSGYGCKLCASNGKGRVNMNKPCILYYFNIIGTSIYKIGITARTVHERYRTSFDREQIRVVSTTEYTTGREAYNEEQRIIKEFSRFRYVGEKLMKSGHTELFTKDILDLDNTQHKDNK